MLSALWLWALNAAPLSLNAAVLYHTEPIGEIYGLQSAGQTFVAPYAGLYRFSVSLADYGRLNTGTVEWVLKASPDAVENLAQGQFPAEVIRGDRRQALEFASLADSAGRAYYFELRAPQAAPGNAITAYIQPQGDYAGGGAYRAGAPIQGDLVFVAEFRVPVWQRLSIWLQQIAAGRPGPFGQAGCVAGLGLVSVAALAGLSVALSRAGEADGVSASAAAAKVDTASQI